jgi:hypothetical protein
MSKRRAFVSDDLRQLYLFDLSSVDEHCNLTLLEAKDYGMRQPGSQGFAWNQSVVEALKGRSRPWRLIIDEPNHALHFTMPNIGQKLLPFILPRKLRAAVAGDLAEDFRTYATQWGRPYALRWLWWELGGLCIRRFGLTAIITAVGAWFRQKLGW